MSKTVTIDGKQYTVPDDATLEEIEAFIAASSPQLHGPELAAQREAEALQSRVASQDPLRPAGGEARKPDAFDRRPDPQTNPELYRKTEVSPGVWRMELIDPQAYDVKEPPKSLQQDIADRLGAGADFLMAPLAARNTGGDDPTNAIVRMAVEPLARLPEALVRDPLKTIAQDYNPIYQAGMGIKDVESAAGKAMQGDFAAAGMQGLEGATQIMGGALGLTGMKGGPKAPGTATSLAQAERMAADTRAAFPAEAVAPTIEPTPAAPMTYEEVAALVRKAARGGMGSKQAEEALARAAPINKDAAAAAERLGIDVPPDVLLDHTQLKEAIGLTRSMPGTLASAAWSDAVERAATKADEAMAMIDGSPDLSEVSSDVLKSMDDTQRALEAQANDMYKAINARIAGEPPRPPGGGEGPVAFKRDPKTAGLSYNDMANYAHAKYPVLEGQTASPYFVAASAIERAGGDRAAAKAEIARHVEWTRRHPNDKYVRPTSLEHDIQTLKAIDEVDPIFFDPAARNAWFTNEIEAGAAAAFEKAGLQFPESSPSTVTPFKGADKPPPVKAAEAAPKAPPTVDLVNSRKLMDSVVRELGGDASKLTSLEKQLVEMASPGRKTPVTYAALMRMKSDVGQALEKASGPYKDVNSGILKRLYGALAEDQLYNVERIGGQQLRADLRLANQLTAKRKALEDRVVSLFGDERNGSIARKLVAAVQGGAKGDITGFNRIVHQLPADLRKKAVATAIAAAAREAKTNGFGFAKYVDLYQGLRRNSEVYKTVVETLGPDSDKFLNDLYKISKRITEARANVKTTGQANQALVQGMMAEGLVQQVMGSTFGRMATTGAATTVAGASGGTLAGASTAMLVNALSRTNKKTINAAGDLFASPEWQQLVAQVAAEDRVNPKAFNAARTSKAFREWTKTAGITDPDAWLRNALAVSIGTGIASNASELEAAQ